MIFKSSRLQVFILCFWVQLQDTGCVQLGYNADRQERGVLDDPADLCSGVGLVLGDKGITCILET